LVQDTLERACSKWLLWRTGTDLRAWLFTLMHNLYLNQRRALPTLAPLDIDDVQDHLPSPAGASDEARDLERCLQRLPADQRAVLLLVAMEDMGYEDTARILNIPIGTVMSRLSRARHRLRILMERSPAPPPRAAASPATAAAVPHGLRRLK
ncbi:MAG: RNA polymerase sigma factor, partial [Gammaproteobacteria bacterium]|nr:RNA polymerase sigma factor [Gammaproteobacteria bacterium]